MPTRLLALSFCAVAIVIAVTAPPTLRGTLPEFASEPTRIVGERFPKQILDPGGAVQQLERRPHRIASATLASDEILLELVGPSALAGVTAMVDDANLSLDAGRMPAAIPRIEARAEALLPLSPDLVVVTGYTRAETVDLLAATGVPLLRLGAYRSLRDVFANIERLAAATGTEAAAAVWVRELRARVRAVEARRGDGPRPRVLYLAGSNYTAGRGSLVDELLTRAGGDNCARAAGLRDSAPISTELAIALQPDIVLVTGWSGRAADDTAAALRRDPRWREVPALQRGRVHVVPSALMLSVTHHAVDALEAIAALLHATPDDTVLGGAG